MCVIAALHISMRQQNASFTDHWGHGPSLCSPQLSLIRTNNLFTLHLWVRTLRKRDYLPLFLNGRPLGGQFGECVLIFALLTCGCVCRGRENIVVSLSAART